MLFKKLFLFALLIIALEQLIYYTVVKQSMPVFWGNEEIAAKMEYLKLHPEINTVFVGSSKVKTQIEPAVFDSVTGKKTTSFNLGCNGLFIPEAFNVLEYLIDDTPVKTVFFELRPVFHIYKENMHITRTTYYHTAASYINTLQNAYHSNLPTVRKLNTFSTFSIAAAEKLLNFNLAEGMINYQNFNFDSTNKVYDENGGCCLLGYSESKALKASHQELDERASLSIQYMKQYSTDSMKQLACNSAYYNKMQTILVRAKKRNIQVILVSPPGLRAFEYNEVLPLFRQLANTPQAVMTDASIYPELYKPVNYFETEHLNAKGAVLYSVNLGKAYNRIMGF